MQAIMVYFSGGGVQIFSMGMVAMLLSAPFRAVAGMNEGALRECPLVDGEELTSFFYLLFAPIALIVNNSFCAIRTRRLERPKEPYDVDNTKDCIHPV